jgi:hypothetical protein
MGPNNMMAANTTANRVRLTFDIQSRTTPRTEPVAISSLIIAGWTGRDRAKMEEHIKELEQLGVKRPAQTPVFYRVSASRLTLSDTIEALGGASSGEVEFMLLSHRGRILVGLGSGHTDREVETYGITVSR